MKDVNILNDDSKPNARQGIMADGVAINEHMMDMLKYKYICTHNINNTTITYFMVLTKTGVILQFSSLQIR